MHSERRRFDRGLPCDVLAEQHCNAGGTGSELQDVPSDCRNHQEMQSALNYGDVFYTSPGRPCSATFRLRGIFKLNPSSTHLPNRSTRNIKLRPRSRCLEKVCPQRPGMQATPVHDEIPEQADGSGSPSPYSHTTLCNLVRAACFELTICKRHGDRDIVSCSTICECTRYGTRLATQQPD